MILYDKLKNKKMEKNLFVDPLFDELELLSMEFPGIPSKKNTSVIDQFEKELKEMSVRQVIIKRDNSSYYDSYYR